MQNISLRSSRMRRKQNFEIFEFWGLWVTQQSWLFAFSLALFFSFLLPHFFSFVGHFSRLHFRGKVSTKRNEVTYTKTNTRKGIRFSSWSSSGVVKTKQRLRTRVWWAGGKPVQELPWLPTRWTTYNIRATYITQTSQPWVDLASYLMGPLPSGEYVLIVVDYYSRLL